jgi:hypothetical protein
MKRHGMANQSASLCRLVVVVPHVRRVGIKMCSVRNFSSESQGETHFRNGSRLSAFHQTTILEIQIRQRLLYSN